MKETTETRSVEETLALGREFASRLGAGECVALIGELGAGKTVFVRGLAAGLGVNEDGIVSSPTFVLVQEYAGRLPLYHVDLYRLADAEEELADLGLSEMLAEGVVAIEWADRAAGALPRRRWEVRAAITGRRSRRWGFERVSPGA